MEIISTTLSGVKLINPDVFPDDRGYFLETYQRDRYGQLGIEALFVQDNMSLSSKGTLRGLHFQHPYEQAKLVYVVCGEVLDVVVDIRKGSPTFGRWMGVRLSAENKKQIYIPGGFAHGFCVLSNTAVFAYKCSEYYAVEYEKGVLWSDSDIGIEWPVDHPILSPKDSMYPELKNIAPCDLPEFI